MAQIPEEKPVSEFWEKNDQELLRELLTAGSENESDQVRMLLHVRSLHRLSEAITSASNTGNFLAKVGIGLTIGSLVLALVQFCSPRSIQLRASTQPLLQAMIPLHNIDPAPWYTE